LDGFCRSRFFPCVIVALVVMLTPALALAGNPAVSQTEQKTSTDLASRLEADRQALLSPTVQTRFPRLGNNFELLGPSTPEFNCIAHTLGIHNRWVNPATGPETNPLAEMDKLYAPQGYRRQQG